MSNLFGRVPSRNMIQPSIAALLGLLLWAPAVHATNLTGHWRTTNNTRYEIVQTGDSVAMNVVDSTSVCEGPIDGSDVELTCDSPSYPATYNLVASGDELTLTGVVHTIQCVVSFCQSVTLDVTLQRCECFDGNSASGDGCDFQCNVEACNECSGDPSTCTPVADATACEDPSLCVSGGACSAGTCAGGVETAQCIDLSGTWLRGIRGRIEGYNSSGVSRSEFVQDGAGALAVFSLPNGNSQRSGTFDVSTMALHMNGTGGWPSCGLSALDGTVTADGNSYTATGAFLATTPHFCFSLAPYDEVGVRCAPASLEPPDGCSVESCQRCEGDPAVCEPVADWTPCESENPCAVLSTCQAGECVAALSQYCAGCTVCDGAGGCIEGPRDDCRAATTTLLIKNVEGSTKSSLRWDWKHGGPVVPSDLAHPDLTNEVSLCVYDESGPEPVMLYSDSVFPSTLDPGWSVNSKGGMRFRSRTEDISAIDLRVGNSPKLSLKAGGESIGPLVPPLPVSLRAQLRIESGACFEGSYEGDDVRRNSNGVFKATSAP